MEKSLVVVESPTKMKTLSKYLGRGYLIRASVGHVLDLPKSRLGVAVEDNFKPVYEVIKGKQKIIAELREAARRVDTIYLAPDPDREGEAIAWHIAGELKSKKARPEIGARIYRILIEEITKKGIDEAIRSPQELNRPRYESQQARRILDRIVGYQISPVLWEKVRRGLSAGRVQSVALRIIVEREREVRAFVPREYWNLEARLSGRNPPPFVARLVSVKGKKAELATQGQALEIEGALKRGRFTVSGVERKQRKRVPPPPFTTSTLQQEAARKLGFTARKTMIVAQQLYEGVELGEEGAVGLITYVRTDSTRLSGEAVQMARQYIRDRHGGGYLDERPRFYRVSRKAQDAHEAVRPTMPAWPPERAHEFLRRDQHRLYRLIWDRFIACQMKDALFDQTTIDVANGPYGLRATGSILKFDGFMKLYREGRDETQREEPEEEEREGRLPEVEVGEALALEETVPSQHFTKPPPRFTEAALVKELEERGIGRPSTYASILSTIQSRHYTAKQQGHFVPTDLGLLVCDLLVEHFPDILNVDFTAQLETQLDEIEEGKQEWQEVLRKFYGPFTKDLARARKHMRDIKREETPTDLSCEKCGAAMVIKWGRHGHFLACSGYPECRNTKEFRKQEDGSIEVVKQPVTEEKCAECGSPMAVKSGRFGKFLACTRYPECKTTRSISTGVACPETGCGGKLLEKRSRRGRAFYGCSKYPKCKHATWEKPVPAPCPRCGSPYLVEKFTKKEGAVRACPKKGCGHTEAAA